MPKGDATKPAKQVDNNYPISCPSCHTSLIGSEIPPIYRKFHGDQTHYNRVWGHYDSQRDMTTKWQCPDCEHIWDRELEKEN